MITSKLKTIFAFVIAALFSFAVQAQDYAFKVTSIKGVAKADGKALFVGTKIQSAQTIVVQEGALVNIAHSNGKTLNISKAGTYKVADLAKGCTAPKGSLSEKYASFVLNELTSGKSSGSNGDNKSKTGSVERTVIIGAEPTSKSFVNFMANKNTKVASTQVTLKWNINESKYEEETVESYTFVVTDLMSNELLRVSTKEPMYTLDLTDEKFSSIMGNALHYRVLVNGDEKQQSEEYLLKIIDGEEAVKIKEDMASLSGDNTALDKMILAKYFEDKGLYANAMYAYEEAVKLSENNEMYENLYQAFLDRNYLTNKSKKRDTKKQNK